MPGSDEAAPPRTAAAFDVLLHAVKLAVALGEPLDDRGPDHYASAMVTRAKLYEEVWGEPMTTVAARYEVSSSFLARICERMNVPRPPRGYWQQLEAGKAPNRAELLPVAPGDLLEWSKGQFLPAVTAPRPLPRAPATPARARRRLDRPALHALVAHGKELFLAAPEPSPYSSDVPYIRPLKRKLIDIVVTKDQLDRSASLMSELLLACEDRGYRVLIGSAGAATHLSRDHLDPREQPKEEGHYYRWPWHPSGPTVAYVGTVPMGLTVYELSENVEVRYVGGKYVRLSETPVAKHRGYDPHSWTTHHDLATGRLAVRVYGADHRASWSQTWTERAPSDFSPTKMVDIVREMGRIAPTVANLIEEGQRQADLRRQEWERHQQEERFKRMEREREEERKRMEQARHQAFNQSRGELLGIVEAWRLAMDVEAFFDDVTTRAAALPDEEQADVRRRLDTARQMLGGTDTLARFRAWRSPDERLGTAG